MPATPAQTLVTYGSCYCVGSQADTIRLALLDLISQNISSECPIPAPVALPADTVEAFSFNANWTASAGATSYYLEVSEFANFSVLVQASNVGNVTTVLVFGLDAETTYYYRVRAVGSCESFNSNVITVTTNPTTDFLVLDNGIDEPTVIPHPVGDYDFSGEDWVSVTGNNCINLTGLDMSDNPGLTSWTMVGCTTLANVNVGLTALPSLDLTGIATAAGNISASSVVQLTTINGSTILTAGSITVLNNPNLTDCDFGALTDVSASLFIESSDVLVNLDLSSLDTVTGALEINSNNILALISLPVLASVGGNCSFFNNGGAAAISVDALVTVGGNLLASNNASLLGFGISSLASVGGNLEIQNNPLLGAITAGGLFGALVNVVGNLSIENNAALTNINVADLTGVGGSISIITNPSIAQITITSLIMVGLNLNISDQTSSLNVLALTALESVGGSLTISGTADVDFGLSALETVGGTVTIQDNTVLASLNFAAFTSPFSASPTSITDNPALDAFSMNGQPLNDGQDYFFETNSLNQTSVDLVLAAGVAGGMTSGTINLSGGTNATPSAGGLANKATLILAGVTVTTN